MDSTEVRAELREVEERLKKIDHDRRKLVQIREGLEAWLDLQGSNGKTPAYLRPKKSRSQPKGARSLRSAVLQVLQEAGGEPLHVRDILVRAQAMGAATEAKNPAHVLDLICYSLLKRGGQPLQRVAPSTWRWIAEDDEPAWLRAVTESPTT